MLHFRREGWFFTVTESAAARSICMTVARRDALLRPRRHGRLPQRAHASASAGGSSSRCRRPSSRRRLQDALAGFRHGMLRTMESHAICSSPECSLGCETGCESCPLGYLGDQLCCKQSFDSDVQRNSFFGVAYRAAPSDVPLAVFTLTLSDRSSRNEASCLAHRTDSLSLRLGLADRRLRESWILSRCPYPQCSVIRESATCQCPCPRDRDAGSPAATTNSAFRLISLRSGLACSPQRFRDENAVVRFISPS